MFRIMHCVDITVKIESLLYFAAYDRFLIGSESKAKGRRRILVDGRLEEPLSRECRGYLNFV